jgi:ABC-type nickel/cobalt efflux system permease component RcnA
MVQRNAGSGIAARGRWAALLLLALGLATLLWPASAAAHPLGNFTTNRYSRLEFSTDAVRITYVLDFAEIPTFQQLQRLDTDGDGQLSEAETTAYLDHDMPIITQGLRLVVGDSVLPLTVVDRAASLQPGQGLPTLRLEAHFSAQLPDGWQQDGLGGYTDRNYSDRLGWRELVIQGGKGVEIAQSSASATDISNELRAYPADFLSSPLDESEATFTLAPGNGAVAANNDTAAQASRRIKASNPSGSATSRVANLVTAERLTPQFVLFALLAAMFWGAVHALTPGHGKTVVGAYLVGARGTARHAAFLGLTVTLTHTAGVFALGLVTLYLSHYILPETLYPWLTVISGALVVGIGMTMVYRRLRVALRREAPHNHDHQHGRDHDHDHHHHYAHAQGLTHTHDGHTHSHAVPGADGAPVTWRSLLALGVSGGLIPCPSALILLLVAISLGRLEFGIVLVLAFSLGLAAVLTGVGLALVYARRFFERFSFEARVPKLLPVASALIISLAGIAIVVESLGKTGVV